MLKNKVLMKLFGLKRQEITGALNNLHNEELHDWYGSGNIIWVITWRGMRWMGNVAHTEQREYRDLVGKPEGKRELERPGSDKM